VRACGLCGSDVEKLGRAPAGTVLGHEIAGELENGDRVTVVSHVPCGTCARCRAGHQSTCGEFRASRVEPGGFAELVRASHCVPVPPELDELASVYVEPLACVLRAVERVPRGRVLVAGCGSVGLLFVQVLLARGDEVAVLEPRADRLARALDLGATELRDPVAAAVLTAASAWSDAEVGIVARNSERAAALARRFPDVARAEMTVKRALTGATLIVNATPVGQHDDDHPLDLAKIPKSAAVLDLVYRRDGTAWVKAARKRGMRAADGLPMLLEQGALAFRRWFGEDPDREAMRLSVL